MTTPGEGADSLCKKTSDVIKKISQQPLLHQALIGGSTGYFAGYFSVKTGQWVALTVGGGLVILSLVSSGSKIDILINNAGQSYRGAISGTKMAVHRQLMEVNYFGHVALISGLLPCMTRHGVIVGISSVQGKIAIPYRSAYSASKVAHHVGVIKISSDMIEDKVEDAYDRVKEELKPKKGALQHLKRYAANNAFLAACFAGGFFLGVGTA